EVPELVRPQDDVERLIPRHVAKRDVDGALHGRVDHDVEAADLGKRAKDRAKVRPLEIEADWMTGELPCRRAYTDLARLRFRGHSRAGRLQDRRPLQRGRGV